MQIPKRKPGKYAHIKNDPHITQAKFDSIKNKLARLKASQPTAVSEVRRLAELGDFSENAAYQMAKGKLRGINQRILELDDQLKHAVIIEPNQNTNIVQLGCRVTIYINNKEQTYQILGSAEASPGQGIISQNSPLGAAVMGHQAGDEVGVQQGDKVIKCRIVEIK